MGLSSNENSDSLGNGSLKLLIELVDTDSVDEVSNIFIVGFASENDSNIQGNKNVVIGWTSSDWEFVVDILLSDQELDLCPWKTNVKASNLFNTIKFTVLGNDGISTLRHINVWGAGRSLWDKNNWGLTFLSIISEPLQGVINIGNSDRGKL